MGEKVIYPQCIAADNRDVPIKFNIFAVRVAALGHLRQLPIGDLSEHDALRSTRDFLLWKESAVCRSQSMY